MKKVFLEMVVRLTVKNTLAHNVFWRVGSYLLHKATESGSSAATEPVHKIRISERM